MHSDRFIVYGVGLAAFSIGLVAVTTDTFDAGWSDTLGPKSTHRSNSNKVMATSPPHPRYLTKNIPLIPKGGVFAINAILNGRKRYHFIIDSGASDVSVPREILDDLLSGGLLTEAEIGPERIYELADGTRTKSKTFILRTVNIGGIEIKNVRALVAPYGSPPLIGQSFLIRLKRWNIDNTKNILVIQI